jgi:hypothetical protein
MEAAFHLLVSFVLLHDMQWEAKHEMNEERTAMTFTWETKC